MSQASEYNELGSGIEKLTRLLMNLNLTHPMPVKRIHELMTWVASGDYDRIVAGLLCDTRRAGATRAEASDAVAHYAERFRNTFRDVGESIADAGKQLSDWLRALGDDD